MKQLKLGFKVRRRLVMFSIVLHVLCFVALLLSFYFLQKHLWVALMLPLLISVWLPIIYFLIFITFSSMVFEKDFSFTGPKRRRYPAANSTVYGFPNSWMAIGNNRYFFHKIFPCRWNSTPGMIEFFSPCFGAGILQWESIVMIRQLTKNRFEVQHDSIELKSPIVAPKKLMDQVLKDKTKT